MAKLGEKPRRFLDETPNVGIVTTLREDGSPHATVVWVDIEDGKVSFNTARGRAKVKHLERDPRASLLIVDPDNPFRWVAVNGSAELTDEGADAQIDKLAKKYSGRTSIRGAGPRRPGEGLDRAREGRRQRLRR